MAAAGGEGDWDPDAPAKPGSGLFGLGAKPADAAVVVVPVPFEATVSYRAGTAKGPAAILRASGQVDLLDRQFGRAYEGGIAMLPVSREITRLSAEARRVAGPIVRRGGPEEGNADHERAVARVDEASADMNRWVADTSGAWLDRGKLVGVLGGDHSVPYGLISELARRHPGLGILHVDAHADLRDGFEGFRWSHASIMRRVAEDLPGIERIVQVGVRDYGASEQEWAEASRRRIRTVFDADLRAEMFSGLSWDDACKKVVRALPEVVHVSFDIDGLSPDLCPHTGTPVPGGLSWSEACHLLWVLARSRRRVVGFDLCEVAPGPRGDDWDAIVGARLLYKLVGCARHDSAR